MNPHIAARRTMVNFKFPEGCLPKQSQQGEGLDHCLFMLREVAERRVIGEKAHRWLGYAQAMLILAGRASLRAMKELNRDAQDPPYALPPDPDGSRSGDYERTEQ